MIKNYLKEALRTLTRKKANTLINIAGLTLGITGSLVLFLFIKDGSSYDNYHSKRDRIYRLVSKAKGNTGDTFTQPSFFKIFDWPILIGSAEKGLDQPNEAIISKKWTLPRLLSGSSIILFRNKM